MNLSEMLEKPKRKQINKNHYSIKKVNRMAYHLLVLKEQVWLP